MKFNNIVKTAIRVGSSKNHKKSHIRVILRFNHTRVATKRLAI